jgi:hypothetical protein
MNMEKQKKVGAIWKKTASNGGEFLSISLELDGKKLSFVAFPNGFKQPGDKKPDFEIKEQRPLAAGGGKPYGTGYQAPSSASFDDIDL